MPIKFNRELSTHLFKYVSTIGIQFNPFDKRAVSARELLRQVKAARFYKSNPKLKLQAETHNRATPPMAHFSFVDGSVQEYETESSHVNEMLFHVHMKAMNLDAEYEMEGKNIDD